MNPNERTTTNPAGVGGTDTSRPVTVQEDRFLREAAKRASTLVAPGKLAPGVPGIPGDQPKGGT